MTVAPTRRRADEIGRTVLGPRPFPALAPQRAYCLPPLSDRTLANGLRVISVHQPSTPMVELRLRIPLVDAAQEDVAATELLATTLLRGDARRSHWEVDTELADLGAALEATRSSMNLNVLGSAPTDTLPAVLDSLTRLLEGAAHAEVDVTRARRRIAEQIAMARAQPQVIAQEALRARCFGDLGALKEIPTVEAVAQVTAAQVRSLHQRLVRPDGAVLVLVGDLRHTLWQTLSDTLETWEAGTGHGSREATPPFRPGAVHLVHRSGAVQSQIRLTAPAPSRTDPRFAALSLANLVFGGYFSSRLVTNIRETKGYAYRADCRFEDVLDQMMITIEADTATPSTAPALAEISAELTRLTTEPIPRHEIESARQFLLGMRVLSLSSQAGLATSLSTTLGFGLPPEWLTTFPELLTAVTDDQVHEAAIQFYRPELFNGVVVGDAEQLAETFAASDFGGLSQRF